MTRTIRSSYYRYWRHPPVKWRRQMNRAFRHKERHNLNKFGEPLRKDKDRGYTTW